MEVEHCDFPIKISLAMQLAAKLAKYSFIEKKVSVLTHWQVPGTKLFARHARPTRIMPS